MVFREQIIVFSQPGALPQNALEQVVAKAKELDMEEVRQQISKQAQPAQGAASRLTTQLSARFLELRHALRGLRAPDSSTIIADPSSFHERTTSRRISTSVSNWSGWVSRRPSMWS
jgi:hypothetical protein